VAVWRAGWRSPPAGMRHNRLAGPSSSGVATAFAPLRLLQLVQGQRTEMAIRTVSGLLRHPYGPVPAAPPPSPRGGAGTQLSCYTLLPAYPVSTSERWLSSTPSFSPAVWRVCAASGRASRAAQTRVRRRLSIRGETSASPGASTF